MTATTNLGFSVRLEAEAPTVPCPCGQSTRIVSAKDGLGCSFHVTQIADSVRHYHKNSAEVYYILEGIGKMELNDWIVEIAPRMVITIEPGTRHRLWSEQGVRTIVVAIPAFDPEDEYFDEVAL